MRISTSGLLAFSITLTCSLYFASYSTPLFAASATNIDPVMLARIKMLPPDQQRKMAEQYGIDFSNIIDGRSQNNYQLAAPGTRLLPERDSISPDLPETPFPGRVLADDFFDEAQVEEEDELVRYGADFFDDTATTFTQVDNIAVPDGYILGLGDFLRINIVGTEQLDSEFQVDRDGNIVIPTIGTISVSGLSYSEAKKFIQSKIKSLITGVNVFVSMGRLKNISVFLAGEVNRPGSYSVSGVTTLTQALYLSGGISSIGSFREIQLRRMGQTVFSFDLYDLFLFGDRSKDVQLKSGDVIFVPTMGNSVSIEGEVLRPAIYETLADETLSDLITMSGGFTSGAFTKSVTVRRVDGESSGQSAINIDLASNEGDGFLLQDGDFVVLGGITSQIFNPIQISGSVVRPGIYAWEEGSRVSSYLGSIEQDFSIEADLNVGLVVRRKNIQLDISVIPFRPLDAIKNKNSASDLLLFPKDQIIVFPLPSFGAEAEELFSSSSFDDLADSETEDLAQERDADDSSVSEERLELLEPVIERLKAQAKFGSPAEVISIAGAVRLPGEYPLLDEEGLSSSLYLAGGLDDGAYLASVEIRRIEVDQKLGAETKFINIDMLGEDGEKIRLQSQDLVRINYLPNWNPKDTVSISGEVVFPGEYAISSGETLSSLFKRAGGFTDKAHPEGVRYLSETTKINQQASAQKLIRRYDREIVSRRSIGGGDTANISGFDREELEDTVMDSMEGRLVIDVPKILRGDAASDIVLQNGDQIEVPIFVEAVSVAGEVYEPGTFKYVDGFSVDDYVSLAAGTTERAKPKAIYVIGVDGSVKTLSKNIRSRLFRFTQSAPDNQNILPGSVIVVPTEYEYQPLLDRYSSVSSAVFQSVTSLAALLSIRN